MCSRIFFVSVVAMNVRMKSGSSGMAGTFWGYLAGIVTGVTYGLNPLFAVPLMKSGVSVDTILFFRYFLVALIMMFLKVYPTWQVWVSIIATFVGVLFLCRTDGAHTMQWRGLALSFASALSRQSLWGQLLSARALL